MTPESAALLITRASMPHLLALSPEERAAGYEILAGINPPAEAEQLRIAAKAIRDAQQAQMILLEILDVPVTAPAPRKHWHAGYESYVQSCRAAGQEPMPYQDWK